MIFAHFAHTCLLLAACLLLAVATACCLLAEPSRSTLDTEEGYKAKTGSASSVTLTLTLTRIEYWDRGGGGRNIIGESSTINDVRTGKWMRAAQKGHKMSCIHPYGHHNYTRIIFWKPMVLTRF